jgi:hypothetical protein
MTDVITGVKKNSKKNCWNWFYQQVIVLVKNIILSTIQSKETSVAGRYVGQFEIDF